MIRLFLHFWNVSAALKIWQREPVSQICVVSFSNFGNELHLVRLGLGASFTFVLHCYYRPHLRCCCYFASHKKICYFASSGLTK